MKTTALIEFQKFDPADSENEGRRVCIAMDTIRRIEEPDIHADKRTLIYHGDSDDAYVYVKGSYQQTLERLAKAAQHVFDQVYLNEERGEPIFLITIRFEEEKEETDGTPTVPAS